MLETTGLIDQVANSDRPALDRVTSLLKLAATGVLPVGECVGAAQSRAMKLLRSEAGLDEARADGERVKLAEIETLMKSLAA